MCILVNTLTVNDLSVEVTLLGQRSKSSYYLRRGMQRLEAHARVTSLFRQKNRVIYEENLCEKNLLCHPSEIRGLHSMKCSSEMLQNLPYLM